MNKKLEDDGIKNKLVNFKNSIYISKKYWLIYLILILIASLSMVTAGNFSHPKMEIMGFAFVIIISIIFITFYSYNHDEKNLYKTVFIVLLVFGLMTSFLIPINSVSDEGEHFVRAEITSNGILFPEYNNGSYETISSLNSFYVKAHDKTVFDVGGDTDKINHSSSTMDSAFEQNPFYGYLIPAIGIAVAKLLDLNVIWMLWLGRIFNTIMYAGLISLAIKKTPKLKIPMFAISALPVCLFQAFSISIDSLLTGLGFLAIAFFIDMLENEFGKKEIIIFSGLCLLAGLCKLPYLALILLLFILPKKNFDRDNYYVYATVGLIFVSLIGILWSKFYATPALYHSWRANYLIEKIDMVGQIQFLLSDPFNVFSIISNVLNSAFYIFTGFFNFYNYTANGGEYCGSAFMSLLITAFFVFICLAYPIEKKFNLKTRLGILLTFCIVYLGTYFVLFLSWTSVGELSVNGVHTRYFLPLFALLPFALNVNETKMDNLDKYVFTFILVYISAMVMSLIIKYY